MTSLLRHRRSSLTLTLAVALAAGPAAAQAASAAPTPAPTPAPPRLVVSYDGGVSVLDAKRLRIVDSFATDGKPGLNVADNGRHVFVTEREKGRVRVLDSGVGARAKGTNRRPAWTPTRLSASRPTHVISHDHATAVFDDATGVIQVISDAVLGKAIVPIRVLAPFGPHHGTAIPLPDGTLLVSTSGEAAGSRVGLALVNAKGAVVGRWDQCPQIHGDAEAKGEVFAFGCKDGVLLYRQGAVRKVTNPDADPTAFSAHLVGSESSTIVAGTYAGTKLVLVDTAAGTSRLVDVGAEYGSIARDPAGDVVVLGTDGRIRVIDAERGVVTRALPAIGPWATSTDHAAPRPSMTLRGAHAYIADPATKRIVVVCTRCGKVVSTVTLPMAPLGVGMLAPGAGHSH